VLNSLMCSESVWAW